MRKISEANALRRMDVPLPDKYKSHHSLVATSIACSSWERASGGLLEELRQRQAAMWEGQTQNKLDHFPR